MTLGDLIEVVITIAFVVLCAVCLIYGMVHFFNGWHMDGLLYILVSLIALRQK